MSLSTSVRSGVFIVLSSKEFVGLVSCRGNYCIRSYRVSNVLLSWYIRMIIISASWLSADRRQRAPVCCGCLLACGCRLRRSAQSSLVEIRYRSFVSRTLEKGQIKPLRPSYLFVAEFAGERLPNAE